MPLYEVEHTIHLSPLQLDRLAEGITRIHSLTFTTPSLFVNVRFTNVAQQVTYVGGKPVRSPFPLLSRDVSCESLRSPTCAKPSNVVI